MKAVSEEIYIREKLDRFVHLLNFWPELYGCRSFHQITQKQAYLRSTTHGQVEVRLAEASWTQILSPVSIICVCRHARTGSHEQIVEHVAPGAAKHGCNNCTVNYHAKKELDVLHVLCRQAKQNRTRARFLVYGVELLEVTSPRTVAQI